MKSYVQKLSVTRICQVYRRWSHVLYVLAASFFVTSEFFLPVPGSGMATRVATGTILKLKKPAMKFAWILRERR
jgi:hypothetical protein